MTLNDIIKEIRNTSSKKEKENLLQKYKDFPNLSLVLELTYSPLIKFGIKKIPTKGSSSELKTLKQALYGLSPLISREITGNAAINYLSTILASVSIDDQEVIELIIGKSLKMGCEVSTINKVFGKNFIKEAPYMGAVPYDVEKVKNIFNNYQTVFSQIKLDGRYTNVVCESDSVLMESRQGLPTFFGEHFDFLIGLEYNGEPVVLNGELIINGLDRYTSNGIISSIVSIGNKIQDGQDINKELIKFKKKHNQDFYAMLACVKMVVWDFIPVSIYTGSDTWNEKYSIRLTALENMIKNFPSDKIGLVETLVVKDEQEAMQHFLSARERGEEGTILKGNSFWKDGKPVFQIKFKNEIFLDLEITGGSFGEKGTKNENVISTIHVKSSCGKLVSSPTNMSEEIMKMVTENLDNLIGTIVTIKCNGVSQDREGNYSLLHPCVDGDNFRTDKFVADSLERCLEIDKASKELT